MSRLLTYRYFFKGVFKRGLGSFKGVLLNFLCNLFTWIILFDHIFIFHPSFGGYSEGILNLSKKGCDILFFKRVLQNFFCNLFRWIILFDHIFIFLPLRRRVSEASVLIYTIQNSNYIWSDKIISSLLRRVFWISRKRLRYFIFKKGLA